MITRPILRETPATKLNPLTGRPRSRRTGRSQTARPIGPYSRIIDRGAWGGIISGKTREGRFLAAYAHELFDHIGANPTTTQRLLVTRAARLALHLEIMDEAVFLRRKDVTETDTGRYMAWSNGLVRTLARLGIAEPAVVRSHGRTLADINAEINAARAGEAAD